MAARTAGEVKFSEAMSWRVVDWRSASSASRSATSGSPSSQSPKGEAASAAVIGSAPRWSPHGVLQRVFVRVDLPEAPLVPARLELRREEGVERVECNQLSGHPPAEADHVGVVVAPREGRGGRVVDDGGSDAGHLVGRDADADAGRAHADPAVRDPTGHGLTDRDPELRVVDRDVGRVGAEVDDLVSCVGQVLGERGLQGVARVVRADGDSHPASVPRAARDRRRPELRCGSAQVGEGDTDPCSVSP